MKDHKILFKGGKVEYVSEKEYFDIEEAGIYNPEGSFWIGKNRYLFDDVQRMEAVEKRNPFDVSKYIRKNPGDRKEIIASIAKGLKKYIDSDRYRGTQAPIKLLDNFRKIYRQID
jgi:hypothetical protein